MIIRILGTGCAKCEELGRRARAAAEVLHVEAEFTKVTDLNKIVSYDVLLTPALVINDKVKASGRLPNQAEIERWIAQESETD